jgi:hypothetical protein
VLLNQLLLSPPRTPCGQAAALAHPAAALRVLGVAGNGLTAAGAAVLSAGLALNASLRRLDLSGKRPFVCSFHVYGPMPDAPWVSSIF